MIVFLALIGIVGFISWRFLKKGKRLSPLGTITMVTGAVKCGKSTLAVHLALRSYRMTLLRWYIRRFFKSKNCGEKPLLYSNIPLACKYVPLTFDVILRKKRIAQKSVVLIDECSLLADSQLIKNKDINEQLLLFYKLFGHMSHGGSLILDTQSIEDNHYAVKRCVNSYLYIHRLVKWIPFILVGYVVEQRYSADGTIVSAETADIEQITKRVIIPKKVWKTFDTYAYSAFTDGLKYERFMRHTDSLKAHEVLSLRDSFRRLAVPTEDGRTIARSDQAVSERKDSADGQENAVKEDNNAKA